MQKSELYDRYLDRLRRKVQDNQYFSQAREKVRQMSQPYSEAKETYEDRLHRENLPEGASQEYSLKHAQKWAGQVSDVYSQAERRQEEYRRKYNEKIQDVAFKRDIAKQQEEELKKKQEENKLKQALGIGGQLAGAVAGSVIPGIGTAAGAALGGGLGSLAGGLSGDETDVGMISQGIGQMAGGISGVVVESKQKSFANLLSENAGELGKLSSDELGALKMGLQSLLSTGQYGKAEDYLKEYLKTGAGNTGSDTSMGTLH